MMSDRLPVGRSVEKDITGADELPYPCSQTVNTSFLNDNEVFENPLTVVNFYVPMTGLVVFNLLVIFGNSLIIAAVFANKKQLLTVTNTFIVSLAAADLLLGLVVLPFSSANEVLGKWPFGATWCTAWLVLDVWLCTASILNLCAISLDRYLAISRPFRYPTIMSPRNAKVLIAFVWILAVTICIPPLLGWKDPEPMDCSSMDYSTGDTANTVSPIVTDGAQKREPYIGKYIVSNNTNSTLAYLSVVNVLKDSSDELKSKSTAIFNRNLAHGGTTKGSVNLPCRSDNSLEGEALSLQNIPAQCALTSSSGYIIYSALGSFWIPMLVMVFFYLKIYQTAIQVTAALRRGVITQRSNSSSDPSLHLRVHRGGGAGAYNRGVSESITRGSNGSVAASWLNGGDVLPPPNFRLSQLVEQITPGHCRPKSGDAMLSPGGGPFDVRFYKRSLSHQDCENNRYAKRNSSGDANGGHDVTAKYFESSAGTVTWRTSTSFEPVYEEEGEEHYLSNGSSPPTSPIVIEGNGTGMGAHVGIAALNNRRGLVHVRTQLRRLNREKKAAKTVGIIVGCFVLCWAPFFTVYLLGAFRGDCDPPVTPPVVFTIVFWLGYCNSAINPFIYAMCSNDFRRAFKKFLCCKHRRTRRTKLAVLISGLKTKPTNRRESDLIYGLT